MKGLKLILASICLVSSAILSDPITYYFYGYGSGSIGDIDFQQSYFEVVIEADTNDIETWSENGVIQGYTTPWIPDATLTAKMYIDGVPPFELTTPVWVFNNQQTLIIGFGTNYSGDLIDLELDDAGLDTYDLKTSYGPIFTSEPFYRQFDNESTTLGILTFTDMYDVTFQAILDVNADMVINPDKELNPQCVNINGHGIIPVTLFGNNKVDVYSVDPYSLVLSGMSVKTKGNENPACTLADFNDDGFVDIKCNFIDDVIDWQEGEGTASLTGSLFDGSRVVAESEICIVP